jgi:hypothetical protein
MAAATAKKVKKVRRLPEDDEQATGLWIEPSLLPTRLAQRGLKRQSVLPFSELQVKSSRRSDESGAKDDFHDDRRFGFGRRQSPE